MNDLISCCGLDCEKCEARIATLTNDDALREKVAESWSRMNRVTITPQMINCTGCRVEREHTPYCESLCEIRKCARQKNYATCAQCPDLEQCDTVGAILCHTPQAKENLKNL
ncbi:MAG: DUF3795 domain-containing protein [Clostridia bacterium]|nr:DUF3795 domain-containing protein [Clostridia bacterium]